MQILKTILPNKCYPLHLKRDEKGNISCSIKTFNESLTLYFDKLNYMTFPNWETALDAAYNVVYKHADLPKPEVKDLVPQLIKMNDKIFLERKTNGTYDISIPTSYRDSDVFTTIAHAKDLNNAINKAEKIISLLEDTSEAEAQ